MTFWQQIQYRAKAIAAAAGISIVALIAWLVADPRTAAAIEHVVPVPFAPFVPLILAGIGGTLLVHHVSNTSPAPTGADEDDLLQTRALSTVPATDDGVETGAGR